MNNGNLLRKKLAEPGIILSSGVYDCFSAKIAEKPGFQVIFTTSGFENLTSFKDYKEIIDIKKYQELEEKVTTWKPSS
ncbi:MAG: hypothetical protein SCARUB_00878 [Candidatus Scalindua rubra]|uniref:Uncharacterized protein n=1 Tax=Candidatus Scalindua rubra TaxID=1872076 RepID=A0A1E3XEE1_9BACT|nr:MAG: hypothetical protein SCARUB_00878 [Candidatus Scalindua rubra]